MMRKTWILQLVCSCLLVVVMAQPSILGAEREGEIPTMSQSKEALKEYNEGLNLFDNLRLQESKPYFEKAVALDSTFAIAWFYLARVQDTPKEFYRVFDKTMELLEHASEGNRLFIRAYHAAVHDDPSGQEKLYKELKAMYPADKRVHTMLGNVYFGRADYKRAIAEYEKAAEVDPDYPQPYNQMGYAKMYMGDYEGAEKALKKYAELIPDEPNPYDSVGEILLKQGKHEESIKAYRKALNLNPEFFASYVGIGANLMFTGRHAEAREQFDKLYEIAPGDGQRRQALFWVITSYVDEGKFDKALEKTRSRRVIAIANHDPSMESQDLTIMGDILYEVGQLEKARENYQEAFKIIDESDLSSELKKDAAQTLLFQESRIAIAGGEMEVAKAKAGEFLEEADVAENVFEMQLYHQLAGQIALKEERYDDAIWEFEQGSQRNPRNLYNMAMACEAKGDTDKARALCAKAAAFNEINYDYAFIRQEAKEKLSKM